MWEDDSIINEICGMIGGCAEKISPEYDPGAFGGLCTEATGLRKTAFEYADGSRTEEFGMRVSLTVRMLASEDGLRAVAALERLAAALETERSGCILRVKTTAWPSKLRERGGAAEYGMTLSFYVLFPGCGGAPMRYINTGSSSSPDWEPVGAGFTLFSEVREAKLHSRRYIHERDYRRNVTGYLSSIRYKLESESEGGAAALLRRAGEVGLSVMTEVLTVLPCSCDAPGTGSRRAQLRRYSAVPSGVSVRGADGALMYEGTLWACGEPVYGTVDPESLEFTPETAQTESEEGCGHENGA